MKNKFFTRKFVPVAQIRRLRKGMDIIMEFKKLQHFTLDDLGMISFPIPQVDGSDECKVSPEKLRKSDEKNHNLRENIRKSNEQILEQM